MDIFNPIKFANNVNSKFLNYQLTAFPLSDPDLSEQARQLLKGGIDFKPLIKGPYVSISRSFKWGRNLKDLANKGYVHPALPGLSDYPQMFMHQDKALQEISKGRHCLISTGTGSGKTEAFLFPILNHCLKLRDENASDGIVAVLVYPMNALAKDQLDRLRYMLAGSGITFGMYIGTTAINAGNIKNIHRMENGQGKLDFLALKTKYREMEMMQVSPAEERLTEAEIAEHPPRILITNVKQLELLMTRPKDIKMFLNSQLQFLVFDEAHTYSGIAGAEVSCLIRRLRTLAGKAADEVCCIGTSATIVDPDLGDTAGKIFAHRFFGIDTDKISVIEEEYETEKFPLERYNPNSPSQDTILILEKIQLALEQSNDTLLAEAYKDLTGSILSLSNNVYESLFNDLKSNNYIYSLFTQLEKPLGINDVIQRVLTLLLRKDRSSTEKNRAELLCYLALGSAAVKDDNPLLKPKLHYFVKGLEGAVIAFEKTSPNSGHKIRLFLSKQEASEFLGYDEKAYLPLFVCKTCGQHYFESYHQYLDIDGKNIKGGQAEGNNVMWVPANELPENRVILTDRFVSEIDDIDGNIGARLEKSREEIFFCHHCGTLQKDREDKCANPKCKRYGTIVKLYILPTENGKLIACPSCKSRAKAFGRNIEPIRPLRAVTVSDVHILSQNMINATRKDNQKLIVFSDNRQDAAFQAGWTQDHARRYRFRHLIYQFLKESKQPVSIGDIADYLFQLFIVDKSVGVILAPEVYELYKPEDYGTRFPNELKYYLRIQILRELGTSFNQKEGLEGWGLLKVLYSGLTSENNWINEWAEKLDIDVIKLIEGIASLLDVFRRNRYLYDINAPIFSKSWNEGDLEIQQGYLPLIIGPTNRPIPPKGIIERSVNFKNPYQANFRSKRGQSLPENFINKWQINSNELKESFLDELWQFLAHDLKLLKPVTFYGKNSRVLEANIYQLDASRIGLISQWETYECNVCHRIHSRLNPSNACTTMHCRGSITIKEPSLENYNIDLITGEFSMLKPHEHTAQIPAEIREKIIEPEFKKVNGKYNTLFATPTLELGVDIGALDMVLMRNMPPTPANYWQRAGRAGRRHRLAVVFTYARRSKHDLYYFEEPNFMLDGIVTTPKFNLRNEVMVRKHVHAVILSEMLRLLQLENLPNGFEENDIAEIESNLFQAFPHFIKKYLFDTAGNYLMKPVNVGSLKNFISKHVDHFNIIIRKVFDQYWPEKDREIINNATLTTFILELGDKLQDLIDLLHLRMKWAVNLQEKYIQYQAQRLLNPEEEKILQRCKYYLKELNQENQDNYTLNVLANEGFLPGYGLYDTGIKAFAHQSFVAEGNKPDFDLSRPSFIALREFIPGNLIYANGGRFRNVLYRIQANDNKDFIKTVSVNLDKKVINFESESQNIIAYSDPKSFNIQSIPISDSDIQYISRISDEEINRFQLPVVILGKPSKSRRSGKVFSCNNSSIQLLYGQRISLFNLGPSELIVKQKGYPICTVCGATRSPFASKAEIDHFQDFHKGRCGKIPQYVAFRAEDNVDGILLHYFNDEKSAINVIEGIIMGASIKLEMERNDLYTMIFRNNDDTYNALLYDPMPGGSGLLDQIMDNWKDIIEISIRLLENCSNKCEESCYTCMRTYTNSFYHNILDRHLTITLLSEYNYKAIFEHDLEPQEDISETAKENKGTNKAEYDLIKILKQYGFPEFETQKRIQIGPPYNSTVPDLYYEDQAKEIFLAIYLDGLSKRIHGNEDRRKIDLVIRQQLEAIGYDVIEIATSDLGDPEAFKLSLKRIASKMKRKDILENLSTK
ncbi:MAG TPA: DEAD/DEAH box helicase [Bacteroidales bacterium]|nr:DEAD/DEAH box helicase [Bacteroidales bacterium]